MILTVDDIKKVFEDLIDGKITREDANQWAYNLVQAGDNFDLIHLPENYFEKLHHKGIMYLLAADLKINSSEYFEEMKYIEEFYKNEWKDIDTEELYKEISKQYLRVEVLADNWVLCPKCDEAFEINSDARFIYCPNEECNVILNNPFLKLS